MRSAHNSAWHGVRALQGLAVAIRDYHYPPFKEEEFEVWRNEVTCPQSGDRTADPNPGLLDSSACALNHQVGASIGSARGCAKQVTCLVWFSLTSHPISYRGSGLEQSLNPLWAASDSCG